MAIWNRDRHIEKVLSELGELPAMPEVVADALHLLEDPTVDTTEISAVIERDPALAARVLRMSNSPYYGMKRQVGSIKLAIVVLGMREVKNILMGMAALETVRGDGALSPLGYSIWQHSLIVAGLCKKLGTELRLGLQGEDFVAGLLHDIGKLMLLNRMGKGYRGLYMKAQSEQCPLFELEQESYGFTHADVAGSLVLRWQLPQTIADALWYHHATPVMDLHSAQDPSLAALVRVSNLAAHDDFSDDTDKPNRACSDKDAWKELDRAPEPIPEPERVERLGPFKFEFESMPVLAF